MTKPYFPYAYFEGKFMETEKATVSIMTNALQYGTAVFGGTRAYYNGENHALYIFRPKDHVARMLNSLKILGVTLAQTEDEIVNILEKLIIKNKPTQNTYLRTFAYAANTILSPNLALNKVFTLAVYAIPLDDYLPTDKGLSVGVSSWRRIDDNAIPARGKIAGSYINSSLARKEAADNGFDEAILLNGDGHVAEGSAENIFMVRRGKLITPPVTDNILEGITRLSIIELARTLGIEVVERSIDRSELYIAEELFFCGTGVQISWIKSVDNRTIGSGVRGPVSKTIADKFFAIVYGKDSGYKHWLLPVHLPSTAV